MLALQKQTPAMRKRFGVKSFNSEERVDGLDELTSRAFHRSLTMVIPLADLEKPWAFGVPGLRYLHRRLSKKLGQTLHFPWFCYHRATIKAKATDSGIWAKQIVMPSRVSRTTYSVLRPRRPFFFKQRHLNHNLFWQKSISLVFEVHQESLKHQKTSCLLRTFRTSSAKCSPPPSLQPSLELKNERRKSQAGRKGRPEKRGGEARIADPATFLSQVAQERRDLKKVDGKKNTNI